MRASLRLPSIVSACLAVWGAMGPVAADTALPAAGHESQSAPPSGGPRPGPPAEVTRGKSALQSKVNRLASQYSLDPDLVDAIIEAESAYDPKAVSVAGAVGLMQVLPATAADYGVRGLNELFEPETNLRTGMRHLRRLLAKYGQIGAAVMAYNAGEAALERSRGFVSYPETQRYTHRVLSSYLKSKGIAPYSEQARETVGLALTPAMARAGKVGAAPREAGLPAHLGDDRWVSAVKRPQLRAALKHQLTGKERHLSPRLSSSTRVDRPSLRIAHPRYLIQPGQRRLADR